MTSKLLLSLLHILLFVFCTASNAAILQVSFYSELASKPITVPAFGSYEADVVIRRGTFASGSFLLDESLNDGTGGFAGPVVIHLQNYLFYNEDDMMALHVQNEGWSALPTDWTADLAESFSHRDESGNLQFELRAYRGLDRYSQNRPFGVIGDVGGTHDLHWISINNQSTTWNTTYVSDRLSDTNFSVASVPVPAANLTFPLGLFILQLCRSRHNKSGTAPN